jgi:hypothetical protein
MSTRVMIATGLTAAMFAAAAVWAQMPQGPGDAGPGRGGFPMGGGFPGGFPGFGQQDDLANVQTLIHASNEEWKVIGPKLRSLVAARAAAEASIDASMLTATGNMAGPFGPGGMARGPFAGGPGFGRDSFEAPTGVGGPGGFGRGRFGGGPGGQGFAAGVQGSIAGVQGPGPAGPDPNGRRLMGPDPNGPGGFGPPGFGPGFGPGGPDPNGPGFGRAGFGRGGFGRGGFDRGGGGGPGFGGPMFLGGDGMKVMEALMELRTATTDPNATAEQIKEKAAAVRKAREKAREKLVASQKDLAQLLTPDQEAVLVMLGYLD